MLVLRCCHYFCKEIIGKTKMPTTYLQLSNSASCCSCCRLLAQFLIASSIDSRPLLAWKQTMTPGKLLYSSVALVLMFFFLYWSGIAVFKFRSQPLSTDIYQTIGDEDGKITFPTITICDFTYAKNHLLSSELTNY